MDLKQLWAKGMKGKVVYDSDEDSYKLQQTFMGFDLCQALWQDFENKQVIITIKEVK